jgi:NAD(P)H-nitrite reductase large subunit
LLPKSFASMRPTDRITLIGDEPEAPYSRMAIPYLLMGNINETGTYLRKSISHYADLRIERVTSRVNAINAPARSLSLSDGSSLTFDKLLIASGSKPAQPPVPGINLPNVHTCWTLGRCPRHHGQGHAGGTGGANGRGFHRLHHHGSAWPRVV